MSNISLHSTQIMGVEKEGERERNNNETIETDLQ